MRSSALALILAAAALAFPAAGSRAEGAAAEELVVVVNAKSPLGESVTRQQLKDIYLVKTKFAKETRLRPLHLDDEELQARFLKDFLGTDLKAYRQWLMMAVFSKGGEAPKSMEAAKVLDAVAAAPGAVGYVRLKDFAPRDAIKRVAVVVK